MSLQHLSPHSRSLLRIGGFESINDVLKLRKNPAFLARELNVDIKVVVDLFREIDDVSKYGKSESQASHMQSFLKSSTPSPASSLGASSVVNENSESKMEDEKGINAKQSKEISGTKLPGVSVLSLLEQQQKRKALEEEEEENGLTFERLSTTDHLRGSSHIITFCKDLDDLLGGGVARGEVTEFCGSPGSGKTQICMQLAVDVAIPILFGGASGEVIYIDTEGSFMIERVVEMAATLIAHLRSSCSKRKKQSQSSQAAIPPDETSNSSFAGSEDNPYLLSLQRSSCKDLESVLKAIHYVRVHDYTEQLAFIQSLPQRLTNHFESDDITDSQTSSASSSTSTSLPSLKRAVKLIIIDSVAFHFRRDFQDMNARTRLLNQHAQLLNKIASDYNIAVVLTNQVTTKFENHNSTGASSSSNQNTSTYLAPALGESWSHAITNRVMLSVTNELSEWKLSLTKYKQMKEVLDEATNLDPVFKPRSVASSQERQNDPQPVRIRLAQLVKSPSRGQGEINYIVVGGGIRQIPESNQEQSSKRTKS